MIPITWLLGFGPHGPRATRKRKAGSITSGKTGKEGKWTLSIVERINNEVPGLALNAWYLDDGTLVGTLAELAAALAIIEQDAGPAEAVLCWSGQI